MPRDGALYSWNLAIFIDITVGGLCLGGDVFFVAGSRKTGV